jgi:hypothetical protein
MSVDLEQELADLLRIRLSKMEFEKFGNVLWDRPTLKETDAIVYMAVGDDNAALAPKQANPEWCFGRNRQRGPRAFGERTLAFAA